jgi:hypothetical protein
MAKHFVPSLMQRSVGSYSFLLYIKLKNEDEQDAWIRACPDWKRHNSCRTAPDP